MAILTNDDSLAWTLSDNTSGSSKSKRGGAGKLKAAPSTQDTWTNSISKYLGASAKMEHDNAARQLSLQEQQHKLEVRKQAFQEEQAEHQKRMMEQQRYGYAYGIAYDEPRSHVSPTFPVSQVYQYGNSYSGQRSDHQPYDRYGHYGGPRQDHVSYSGYGHYGGQREREREQFDRFREREKLLKECLARGGDNYYEICDLLSMSHSGQGSSSKFKSPRMDESFDSSHQSATINLTGSKGKYVK